MLYSFPFPLPAILLAISISSIVPAAFSQAKVGPDDGRNDFIRFGIPEPMVFDLVRPLGAEIGEFELPMRNSNVGHSQFAIQQKLPVDRIQP